MKTRRMVWLIVITLLLPQWAWAGLINQGSLPNDIDPQTAWVIEEFSGGGGTSGTIGQLGWALTSIGSTATIGRNAPAANHPSVFNFATAAGATAGQGGMLSLGQSTTLGAFTGLSSATNWESYWVAKLSQTAATRWREGFFNDGFAGVPLTGIWVRYDTNTSTAYSDTVAGFVFECSTQGTQKTVAADNATCGLAGACRATNVVTVTTTASHGIVAGNIVVIAGVTDASFNGTFLVASAPSATTFTYAQTGGDAHSGTGTATPAARTQGVSTIGVDTNYHTMRIRSLVVGTVLFSVDGETEVPIANNCPNGVLSPGFHLLTDATAQKLSDLDFFSFLWSGISR